MYLGTEHSMGNHGWAPMRPWRDQTQTLQHQRKSYSKNHLLGLGMAQTAQKCNLCITLYEICASPNHKWMPVILQFRHVDRIQIINVNEAIVADRSLLECFLIIQ